eukprot:CAMPEP_0169394966 /NCGR_PEP_ID=MMETSP1017-20121227/50361_1 /TAXON_ID=342587 /ORGANISM="Karlodinium micrum, Strain CCMP2283" /LENGTH=72 /DNA_ID=CAMNT_0009498863 /DNA_START=471 /DNA_END=688 /DNA_ORIENTATION=-
MYVTDVRPKEYPVAAEVAIQIARWLPSLGIAAYKRNRTKVSLHIASWFATLDVADDEGSSEVSRVEVADDIA